MKNRKESPLFSKRESESTPILSDSKQSKIDLNQFINLTRYKDMRKISLPRHLCPKILFQNKYC